jgi:peroxiredoxin
VPPRIVIILWMPNIHEPAPDLELPDLDGAPHRLADYRGHAVVINFWSAECPWSERADRHLLEVLGPLDGRAVLLPVASNANEPEELLREVGQRRGLPLILRDSGGAVARLFGAQTTPHAFVVDRSGILRYQGAVDDTTFRQRTPTRWYVKEALDALLAGRLPETEAAPPYGCALLLEM